ncbi:hypothetical protein UFOVP1288_23 [uncultured Caudovirales phage]|uniref:DUF6378 domain-containing protein n=1 Tax=uncultured Caudovirales phage TaxID=2100421 RepID=A0A6J5RMJ9_9CAUD|nr:hypothetical protein UFOVP1195_23 [uncultured Caudovirales phage]CAB4195546.1 hypothetical protein UFOVP1288_23 [uncultured Caudovirales phage]CAB4204926.1 hypothetical protein UFOVP1409_23 [uncultured Caudovirales phage]
MKEQMTIRAKVEAALLENPNLTCKEAKELYGVRDGNFYEYRRVLLGRKAKKKKVVKKAMPTAKPVDFTKAWVSPLQDNYLLSLRPPLSVPPKAKPEPVKAILQDRQKTYGEFKAVAHTTRDLMDILYTRMAMEAPAVQEEALHMISSKLARIVNGDLSFVDSWRDIAGYATLVVEHLEAE